MSTRQDGRRSTRSRKTDAVVRELLSDDGTVVEYGRTVEQNAAGGGMAQSESAELSALEAAQNRLDRFREELQQQDRDQIKKSVAYVDDVTSAIWAAPFFGAFASMRLMMLGLCSELMMLVAIMFTDGGLAYPGWIAFSAAVLALVTGMPMWWEPMTLNALRVHIIVGAAACALTTIIATAMGNDDRDATLEATGEPCDFDCGIDDPNQRNKVVGLYAGQAALELVGLLFALRVRLDRGRVQKYEVARLGEWTMDVENYVFSRYVHGGRRQDDGRRADRRRVTRVDDEEVYAGRRDVYQDPDLQALNSRVDQLLQRNDILEDGARGIRQLLDDRIKREQTHTVDTLMLVQKAQKSEDACIKSKSRMHRFEEDTKRLSAEMFEAKHEAAMAHLEALARRADTLESS